MLKRADHLDRIIAALGSLAYYLKLNSAQGFISPAAHLEDFCIPLLGAVYGYDLTNANADQHNAPAIDLIDKERRVGIQVTINDTTQKTRDTHKTASDPKHDLKAKISHLIIFFFVTTAPDEPETTTKFTPCPGIKITSLDLTDLIKVIGTFPPEKQEEIAALLDRELSGGSSAQYVTTITQISSIITNYVINAQNVQKIDHVENQVNVFGDQEVGKGHIINGQTSINGDINIQ